MPVKRLIFATLLIGTGCSDPPGREPDVGIGADIGEPDAIYVNENAQPDGDGSAVAPFQTLDEAMAAVDGTPRFILAPGAYEITSPRDFESVRLEGAGPDATEIAGLSNLNVIDELAIDSATATTPDVLSADALLLTGVDVVGDTTVGASEVVLDGVQVVNAHLELSAENLSIVNLDAEGATLSLRAVSATVRELDVELTDGPALTITGPGDWDIEDLGLADIGQELDEPDGDAGVCLVIDGASVDITSLDAVRCAWRGIAIRNESVVTITDSVVAGAGNTAVSTQSGSDLTIVDMEVSDASVLLFTNEASLTVQAVIAQRSRNSAVLTGANASVTITESTFLDSPNGHISILGPDTEAVIQRNLLDGTDFESCFAASSTNSVVDFTGNTVRNCAGAAVTLGSGSSFIVSDNEISNVFAVEPFPDLAEGVSAVRAGVDIRGNVIRDVAGAGVALLNAWGEVTDNQIADTGDAGIRTVERGDGNVTVRGNDVARATGVGIAAFTVDITIDDNRVDETQVSFADGLGEGVLLATDVTATVTGNEIRGSGYNGIRFVDGVTGTIEGNTIGGSGLNDIREDCGAFEPNDVTIGENNLEGDVSVCD